MKILLIGASGTLGSAVKERLEKKAEVITAGRHSGDVTVDITSVDSIKKNVRTGWKSRRNCFSHRKRHFFSFNRINT